MKTIKELHVLVGLPGSGKTTFANQFSDTIKDEYGFNAKTGEIVNMYEEGIIDPAKAARLALENSVSIGNLFLSTQCVIVPKIN